MLRTIKCWVVYDPLTKLIYPGGKTKREAADLCPRGCVLVYMSGHYLPKRRTVGKSDVQK